MLSLQIGHLEESSWGPELEAHGGTGETWMANSGSSSKSLPPKVDSATTINLYVIYSNRILPGLGQQQSEREPRFSFSTGEGFDSAP